LSGQSQIPAPKKDDRPFLGRAVVGGTIRYLSVSQVKQFDETQEGGCPTRWAFQKLFGKKEPKSDAQMAGNQYAKEAEHYLTKGEDVLGSVMRAGKHLMPHFGPDLEVEKDIVGDIVKVLAARDEYLRTGSQVQNENVLRLAHLTALGIPFTGPFDIRHRRGEYIDEGGVLRREADGLVVVEIVDHKTTKRISNYTSKNGKTYSGYAKSIEQILIDPQMLGYGVGSANAYLDATHTRLSHLYYQRENGYVAEKRTGLLTVAEVRQRWEQYVVPVVGRMVESARATRPEDVPKNLSACKSFGKDCPHIAYCPRPAGTIHDLFKISRGGAEMGSGLFATLKGSETPAAAPSAPSPGLFAGVATAPQAPAAAAAPGMGLFAPPAAAPAAAPPAPQIDMVAYEAERAAARARLLAESAPQAPYVSVPQPPPASPVAVARYSCGAPGCGVKCIPGYVVSDHSPSAFMLCANCKGQGGAAPPLPLAAAVVSHIGAVNPPDAPPLDPVADSAPLKPEEIAAITDPELKARAEAHAVAWKAAQPPPEEGKEKTSGKCSRGSERVKLTQEQAGKKRYLCSCGKELKIKPSADFTEATLPGHIMPKVEGAVAPAAAVTVPPPAPPALPVMVAAPAPPPPPPPGFPFPAAPPSPAAALAAPPPPPPGYLAPDALQKQTALPETVVAPPAPPPTEGDSRVRTAKMLRKLADLVEERGIDLLSE
jgi:hypothetical protein